MESIVEIRALADYNKLKEFISHECEHARKKNSVASLDNKKIMFIFNPTHIGTKIKIKCACELEEDISDYPEW